MKAQKVRSTVIGIILSMLVLTGCGVLPEQPIASPSAMPTEGRPESSPTPEKIITAEKTIVEVCKCANCVKVEAWIDQNENGKREPEEMPLQGVTFFSDAGISATSDETGLAIITVAGCDCEYFTVYPEVPSGYRLTTQARLSNTACPEDKERDSRCPLGTCSFGFAGLPAAPRNLRETYLHGADLQGQDLRNADLSAADLSGANLRGADLRNADLSGADLSGADLRAANLRGTKIDDATQIDEKWRLAWEIVTQGGGERELSSVDLRWANLMGADLHRANLRQADLFRADLGDADLSEAILSEANIEGVNLKGANLSGADLAGADLSRADLTAAILRAADLRGADLFKAKYDQDTMWPAGFDPVAAGAVLEE